MKIFQLNVSYTEQTEALITLNADSVEAAIERVKTELGGQVTDLVVKDVQEVTETVHGTENVIDMNAARVNQSL